MSHITLIKYRTNIFSLILVVLFSAGITEAMDCCDVEDNSGHSCCCTTEKAETTKGERCSTEVPDSGISGDNMKCPCVVHAPKEKPEAVALSFTFDQLLPVSTTEFEDTKIIDYHTDKLSYSLHKQHSSKTYKFTEAYLN